MVEVALSQPSDDLEDKVCEYMKESNGKVKTVIGIDLPYQGPAQRVEGSATGPCLYTVYRAV